MKERYMKAALSMVVCGVAVLFAPSARAEDIKVLFDKVNKLVEAKNYPGALTELSWAQKELEKLHQQQLAQIIPSEVEGFKGNEPEIQSAMGFTTLEREYVKGEQTITMSISGGAGGDGLGGLAGLAKMGMMMGGTQPGIDKIRLGSLAATLDTTATPELTVFLDSGAILQLRSGEGVDGAGLKKFAEGLKISDIDTYLKGAKG